LMLIKERLVIGVHFIIYDQLMTKLQGDIKTCLY